MVVREGSSVWFAAGPLTWVETPPGIRSWPFELGSLLAAGLCWFFLACPPRALGLLVLSSPPHVSSGYKHIPGKDTGGPWEEQRGCLWRPRSSGRGAGGGGGGGRIAVLTCTVRLPDGGDSPPPALRS